MTPEELVAKNLNLVSLPEICIQVQELADSSMSTAESIGEVISTDAALSARLLKIVNSAFYGMPSRIDTISRAVNLLGMRELKNLTFAASAAEVFSDIPPDLVDMAGFWQHSIYTGLVARQLAVDCHVLHAERLFTAGLLHDVGRLLIYIKLPELAAQAEIMRQESERHLCDIEDELLGFDHSEVGYALLSEWKLPGNLCATIRYHHRPQDAHDAHLESAILHIADIVAHCAQDCKHDKRSAFYDPYGALLDSDLNAEEITIMAAHHIEDEAFALTRITAANIQKAIDASACGFNQVLDLVYPMAWENPR